MINQFKTLRRLTQHVGLWSTLRIIALRMFGYKGFSVYTRQLDRYVTVRMNNCDLTLLIDTLCSEECEVDVGWVPKTIVDLGANIGLTSLKLRKQFPSSYVVSVEPDKDTLRICEKNLNGLSDCKTLFRAVGYGSKRVICSNPDAESISHKFVDCADNEGVESTGISAILEENNCHAPILVKMDIEGAEEDCFKHASEWLPLVKGILVEPHSAAIELEINRVLRSYGFSTRKIGEKIFGERA